LRAEFPIRGRLRPVILLRRLGFGIHFTSVNDPNGLTDTPPFIQLLGINNSGTIVGYTGMGAPNPNRGIILTLPNSFTSINPNINTSTCTTCQVQVFGITNSGNTTDGFFTELPMGLASGPVATDNSMATGVNHSGMVVGFDMPSTTVANGFLLTSGVYTLIQFPGSTFTQPLGLNDNGEVVGTYTDANGNMHGFEELNGNYISFDAPGGIGTTVANGVNGLGDIVGFSMNGAATVGFEAVPTPEPGTLLFGLMGAALMAITWRIRRRFQN